MIKVLLTVFLASLLTMADVSAQVFDVVSDIAGISSDNKPVFGNPVWGDMNNDGNIDLMVPHHGNTPDIYFNNGDGTFASRHVINVFGADYFDGHNDFHGYSFTDFNNDNNLDLFITLGAKQGEPGFTKSDLLYQGDGRGSFTKVSTQAGVENPIGRGRSSCWFDYDGDGKLDFFLKNLETPSSMFVNSPTYQFEDIADSAGLNGFSLGSICSLVDYDNDGLMDMFLNSGSLDDTLLKQMAGGLFSDVSVSAGIAALGRGHAAAWGDYNNDGWMDLYVARSAPSSYSGPMSDLDLENTLYSNNGDGTFSDTTVIAGLSGNFNTSAAVWGDVNNDGLLDLLVTNAGEVDGAGNASFLYINQGDGAFTDVANGSNLNTLAQAEGHRYMAASLSDYDNDGALDIVMLGESIGSAKGPTELFRNRGGINNYLKVELQGRQANRPAIGAYVSLQTADAIQFRQHTGATDGVRYSQSIQPLHFGIGTNQEARLVVAWPGGSLPASREVDNLGPNQTVKIVQGRSIVRGKPVSMTETGCFVFRNNRGWNLRCVGGADKKYTFTGTITSNGSITGVETVRFETHDQLTVGENTIEFNMMARQGHDTIIFTTAGDTVTIDILQDGVAQPRSLRIGENKIFPARFPVTLVE